MKKLGSLFFLCCLISMNSNALITVSSGTVLTLGDVTMNQSIEIESGGLLIINGDVIMANDPYYNHELYIQIKDGGKMQSYGGSLTSFTYGDGIPGINPPEYGWPWYTGENDLEYFSWRGIFVEAGHFPTIDTSPALFLKNFTIKHARTAISVSNFRTAGLPTIEQINRSIHIENTIFDQITSDYFTADASITTTWSYIAAACCFDGDIMYHTDNEWTEFNLNNNPNTILFKNCQFLGSGSPDGLPFKAKKVRNITIEDCVFDDRNADAIDGVGIHLDRVKQVSITGCTFRETGKNGIVLNGKSDDVKIENNTFEFDALNPLPNQYRAISVGGVVNDGSASNFRAISNSFTSLPTTAKAFAIVVGHGVVEALSGTPGYLHSGNISYNDMTGFAFGVVVQNNTGLFTDYLGEGIQDLAIYQNNFEDYRIGIELSSKNIGTTVNCNIFRTGLVGFNIPNFVTEVQNWGSEDWNNSFIGSTIDILNLKPTAFQYSYMTTNPYKATTFGGSVLTNVTASSLTCSPDPPGKSLEIEETSKRAPSNDFTVYPNPTNGLLTIDSKDQVDHKFMIINILGKVVYEGNLSQGLIQIDLSSLKKGVYIVNIYSFEKNNSQRLIIQ